MLIVQHADDDPPGRLGRWLREPGCRHQVVRCHLGERLPSSLTGFGALVVLGGGIGAYDDASHAWLAPAKALLSEAIERDVPTLGVCLGHQLLAVAGGGRVQPADRPQNGVTAVHLTAAGSTDALFHAVPNPTTALHWNNDLVVAVPPGAAVLASSPGGVQAMRLGLRVWGVQFHPEVDVETVRGWARHDVQTGALSRSVAESRLAELQAADRDQVRVWRPFVHRFAQQALLG